MTNKIAGLQYVDEFTFSKEQGFTGSAGVQNVKGYMRGGHVKKDMKYDDPGPLPKNVKAKGGRMKKGYAHGGEVGITTKQSKQMPQKAEQAMYAKKSAKKAHGGKMSMHDKLRHEGEKMGYKYGGSVKDTSAEFVEKSGAMASMDHGVYPAQSRTQAEKEAGGRKRLKPKFNYGGKVHTVRDVGAKHGGHMKGDMGNYSEYAGSRRKASKSKMPKNVKGKGGLAAYAQGGHAKPSDLGTGVAARAAESEQKRQRRTRSTIDKALAASRRAMGVKDKPPERYVISHDHAVGGPVSARHGGHKKSAKGMK